MKLTLSDAMCIRARVRKGEKPSALAREFKVLPGTITAITQGRTHRSGIAGEIKAQRMAELRLLRRDLK